jgi:hypothetical protein
MQRKDGRRSLDISDLVDLTCLAKQTPLEVAEQSLKKALTSLTVKYFQGLRRLELSNKSSVNTVITFLSLLSPIDSSILVSSSFKVTESQAVHSLHSYCAQPGNIVRSLRKFSADLGSVPADSIKKAKERLHKVKDNAVGPSLTLMLQFTQAALNCWEALHCPPVESEPRRPSNHTRNCTPNFEPSFAEVSFATQLEEVQDSYSRSHSPPLSFQKPVFTVQSAFRAFLTSKLKCLQLNSRVIPIKAQALTKAEGSKTVWHNEFLEEYDCDPREVAELFCNSRFKTEVLRVATLLI